MDMVVNTAGCLIKLLLESVTFIIKTINKPEGETVFVC